MKKVIISLFSTLICLSAQAEINSKELVDISKKHWAYNSVVKTVDTYKVMSCFVDHTFRGEDNVTRFELSIPILRLVKYLETNKRTSLKRLADEPADKYNRFSDIDKNDSNFLTLAELKNDYQIVLLPPDQEKFSGKTLVTRYELAYSINCILASINNKNKASNPYKAEKNINDSIADNKSDWIKNSVKLVSDNNIMSLNAKKEFNGNDIITRYELANSLNNLIEYIDKNQIFR